MANNHSKQYPVPSGNNRGFDLAWITQQQRIAPETIDPPAQEIVFITQSLQRAAETGKQVYLLHMPRGATPIVEGIRYAWKKLYGAKQTFHTVLVPISRENASDALVKQVFEERLREIPEGAVVFYVDEVVSGRNARANIEDLYKILKKRKCEIISHLLISRDTNLMDLKAAKGLFHLRRYKHGLKVIFHPVPDFLPWTDNTKYLGQNWGLVHRLPLKLILTACGNTIDAKRDLGALAKEFSAAYASRLAYTKQGKFRKVNFPSTGYNVYYGFRDSAVMGALKGALEKTGFARKYGVAINKRTLLINGHTITIPRLKTHLTDTHPSHEISRGRAEYKHHLSSDPFTLIDFSRSGEERFPTVLRLIQPHSSGSYDLMHALKSSIGREVHKVRHPSRRRA